MVESRVGKNVLVCVCAWNLFVALRCVRVYRYSFVSVQVQNLKFVVRTCVCVFVECVFVCVCVYVRDCVRCSGCVCASLRVLGCIISYSISKVWQNKMIRIVTIVNTEKHILKRRKYYVTTYNQKSVAYISKQPALCVYLYITMAKVTIFEKNFENCLDSIC